jgi:hypothetical protein
MLLLDRLTTSPSLGAAELKVTVQESEPDPVMDPILQETALNAAAGTAVAPVPLRAITTSSLVEGLLLTVS